MIFLLVLRPPPTPRPFRSLEKSLRTEVIVRMTITCSGGQNGRVQVAAGGGGGGLSEPESAWGEIQSHLGRGVLGMRNQDSWRCKMSGDVGCDGVGPSGLSGEAEWFVGTVAPSGVMWMCTYHGRARGENARGLQSSMNPAAGRFWVLSRLMEGRPCQDTLSSVGLAV